MSAFPVTMEVGKALILKNVELSEDESSESEEEENPENDENMRYGMILGRVSRVRKEGFTVVSSNSGRSFKMTYDGFCPVRTGDTIKCDTLYNVNDDENQRIIKPPFVQSSCDPQDLKNIFITAFRKQAFGGSHAGYLYGKLEETAKNLNITVSEYLTRCAERWYTTDSEESYAILKQAFDYFLETKIHALKILPPKGKNPSVRMAKHLLKWWRNCNDMRLLYLLGLKRDEILETELPLKDLYERLLKNPFTVPSIPLNKCVEIDQRIERVPGPTDYQCGIIVRDLWNNLKRKSWTCTSKKWLAKRYPDYKDLKDVLTSEYEFVFAKASQYDEPDDDEKEGEMNFVYFDKVYKEEIHVAEFIINAVKAPSYINGGDPIYGSSGMFPNDEQKEAIKMALSRNFSCLTGGPGTGKTTTIKEVIANLKLRQIPYACCAFTGAAVTRVEEVIEESGPATMDRMIMKARDYHNKFSYLIIDEVSMVSLHLFYRFITTFTHQYSILCVGDPNQLPSIEYGSLFNSIIQSYSVPQTLLIKNHRVVEEEVGVNGIVHNLTSISLWRSKDPMPFVETPNFAIKNCKISEFKTIFRDYKTRGFTPDDFVVITPYRRTLDILNRLCQAVYYSDRQFRKVVTPSSWGQRERYFFLGDKVMMLRNNYDVEIMNGNEGKVIGFTERHIIVEFKIAKRVRVVNVRVAKDTEDEMMLDTYDSEYQKSRDDDDGGLDDKKADVTTNDIDHCYVITCHKSQGREYDEVMWYQEESRSEYSSFLNRNLVYTGISRAKKKVVVLGSTVATSAAIGRSLPYRCENLDNRLRDALPRLYRHVDIDVLGDSQLLPPEDSDYAGYDDDDDLW